VNILIIEDEALAARRLKTMVTSLDPTFHIAAILDSVKKSVDWLKKNAAADLVLLDIELSDGKSFEIFHQVEVQSPVIFITAYDEYALRAFKVNSIDYLLKPVKEEELEKSIAKLRLLENVYSRKKQDNSIKTLLKELQEKPAFRERFLIKQGDRLIPVETAEIAFFYTREKSNYLRTKENQSYIIDLSLDEIEGMVDPKKFFRTNRQTIISAGVVEKVHLWFGSKLKVDLNPKHDEETIVSREKATAFRQWLGE
jgi:two-component system response regulator LytT